MNLNHLTSAVNESKQQTETKRNKTEKNDKSNNDTITKNMIPVWKTIQEKLKRKRIDCIRTKIITEIMVRYRKTKLQIKEL